MTASIEARLKTLEARLIEPEPMFWIRSVSPGHLNRPVTRIRHHGQEWHRRDGESEAAFKGRAKSEAVLQPGHSALLMLMN